MKDFLLNDYSNSLLFFSQTLVYNMEDNEGRGATPQCDNDPNFDYNMEMDAQQATDRKNGLLKTRFSVGQVISAMIVLGFGTILLLTLITGVTVYSHIK